MKELKDTVDGMLSSDYKERFKAEYYQLKIRFDKLYSMVRKWDERRLDFAPTCPREIYDDQLKYMYNYLKVLKNRAEIENIEL
jgi:hypothetical protein